MDFKKCLRVHGGHTHSDNESDNGCDTFDEVYNRHKPAPVPYSKFKDRIVNVHADSGAQDSSLATDRSRNNYWQPLPDPAIPVARHISAYDSDDCPEASANQARYNASLSPTISQRHDQGIETSSMIRQHQANTRTQMPQAHQARSRKRKQKQAVPGPGKQQKTVENANKYSHVPDLLGQVVVRTQPTPSSVNSTQSLPMREKKYSVQQPVQTISGQMVSHGSANLSPYRRLVAAEPASGSNSPDEPSRRQQHQQQRDDNEDIPCCTCCSVS